MKKLLEAIKGMAVNYVIGVLKEKEDELAKQIASKVEIPFVKEEDEVKLAKGVISAVGDVLEGLAKKK
tara:strand:+ start:284 stop:487 length:204 start_codon:yes stop_codon:yes gene_type:complete